MSRPDHPQVVQGRSQRVAQMLGTGLLTAIALVVVAPVVWSLVNAFKSHGDIKAHPWALPQHIAWSNFGLALEGHMGRYLLNSVIVTGIAVVVIVALSAPAAYAFARLQFRGSGVLLGLVLSGMLIPVHAVLIPLYQFNPGSILLKRAAEVFAPALWLSENYGDWVAVIGPYVAFGLPLTVLLLRAYFIGIPQELSDAALIDGCSHWRILRSIFMPVAKPAVATVAIFQGAWIWNELVMAMVFINEPLQRTLTIGLMSFQGEHATDWGVVLAGVFLAVAPVLVLYFAFQQHIIKGLTAGAVK